MKSIITMPLGQVDAYSPPKTLPQEQVQPLAQVQAPPGYFFYNYFLSYYNDKQYTY